MKVENKIITVLLFVLCIVLIITLSKKKDDVVLERGDVFKTISVLDDNIQIKDNIKKYEIEVDCSLLDLNRQIIAYELNDEYRGSNVSVNINVYKKDKLLKEDYKDATNMDIVLLQKDKGEENIYLINALCK